MQIRIKEYGRYFEHALGPTEAPARALPPEAAKEAAPSGPYGVDRVDISAEGSRLQKMLNGTDAARPDYNIPRSMGESGGAAEENPDEKIRELQKKLREATKKQKEAMQDLQEASRALTEAQAAGLEEVKAAQNASGNGENPEDANLDPEKRRAKAQQALSEALADILSLQQELKSAMQAKMAQSGEAMGDIGKMPTVMKGALYEGTA